MATCECSKRAIKIAEKARRSVNSEHVVEIDRCYYIDTNGFRCESPSQYATSRRAAASQGDEKERKGDEAFSAGTVDADDGVADELRNVRHVHDGELLEKHRRTTRARSDAEFSSAISGR